MKHLYKIVLLSIFIFTLSLTASNKSEAACAKVGEVITAVAANAGCQDEPDGYGVVAFKLYLCTAAPTSPTIARVTDLSNCILTFENTAGSSVTLSTDGDVDLGGTQTKPPPGAYTHAVMHMDNTFAITAKKEFAAAFTGEGGGLGVFCVTKNGAGTSGSAGNAGDDRSTCGDNTLTAGTYTETLTSFDNPIFSATATELNVAGTGSNITAHLLDTNEFLAVNDADVDTLLGIVEFASAATITENTENIDISFNVGEGMSVDGFGLIMFFGSGPFQATVSTN